MRMANLAISRQPMVQIGNGKRRYTLFTVEKQARRLLHPGTRISIRLQVAQVS